MIRWLVIAAWLLPAGAMAQTPDRTGVRAFQRCYSCHSVVKGEKGLSGPNLAALDKRPVASDPDFDYSVAFQAFGKTGKIWSPQLLDQFLTDPEKIVPGNQMGFFGLKDAKERFAIIAYIMAKK